MSLRESLADKFQEWACSQCDLPRSEWLEMADECIRQMEWARRENNVTPLHDDMVAWHKIPLTAAPEGWKP